MVERPAVIKDQAGQAMEGSYVEITESVERWTEMTLEDTSVRLKIE